MAKVLVIDGEQGIRSLLDTLLSRTGYDVVLANGGQKGLEIFAANARMSLCLISICRKWMGSQF